MAMRRGRWWATALLVTGVMTGAPGVMAQGAQGKPAAADKGAPAAAPTPGAPVDADKEATRLVDEGKKAAKAGQWEKARESLAAAYKLKPDPALALPLGQAELKSSKARDAAEHLDLFLRDAKAASAEEKATAQKLLDDAKGRVAAWYVSTNIEGAEVTLDGKPVGQTPLPGPLYLDPGAHELEVKKAGYQPATEQIAAGPGNGYETVVELAPAAEPKVEPPPPPPEKKEKEPPPPPSPKWRTYGMIGGAGLAVVGLGLGVGLTMAANGKSDEADQKLADIAKRTPNTYGLCGATGFAPNKTACADLKDTLASQDAYANGAMVGYVIGGVAAVGTLGLFLLPKLPFGRKLMGVNVVPVLGGGQTGGVVTGSF